MCLTRHKHAFKEVPQHITLPLVCPASASLVSFFCLFISSGLPCEKKETSGSASFLYVVVPSSFSNACFERATETITPESPRRCIKCIQIGGWMSGWTRYFYLNVSSNFTILGFAVLLLRTFLVECRNALHIFCSRFLFPGTIC